MDLKRNYIIALLILSMHGSAQIALGASGEQHDGVTKRVSAVPINSTVVYVNAARPAEAPTGESWITAYRSLAAALASDLTDKKEIWVVEGTYYPTNGTDRDASFNLVKGIGLYGGFSGDERFREQRNLVRNATVLSGEIGDISDMADNSLHVVVGADDAVLDGFTIRDGYAILEEGETDTSGSLVDTLEEAADMEILRIVTNIKSTSGAGLLNVYAGTSTKNCIFKNNHASKGGAVYNMVTSYYAPGDMDATVTGDAPSFENCIFEYNSASARGGAVNNDFFTTSSFVNCVFLGNTCDAKGGAVYSDMGSPSSFINVLFMQNSAERGAALVADGVSPHRLAYATFVANTASDIGAALYQGTTMGEQFDGEAWIGNEVHLYGSIVIGNESGSSSSSISNWHDGLVMYDEVTIMEDIEGSLEMEKYLNPNSYVTRSNHYGWHPRRRVDIDYWTTFFENDPNRTYTDYSYDISTTQESETRTLYVDSSADGAGNGLSWADAYTSLSEALENTTEGAEIWVAAGTYKPTTGTDRSQTFVMKEGVALYGGFTGSEDALFLRDYETNLTILSGDIGTEGDSSDNSYHVLFGATGATLDGFVVQFGNADGDFYHSRGGGLLCYNGASPQITNTTFTQNIAVEGGAIAAYSFSAPTITNCAIVDNNADIGGGVLFRAGPDDEESGAMVNETAFSGNTASDRGGAVYIDYGAWPSFNQCTIVDNISMGTGGGIYVDNNSSQLSNIEARFTDCNVNNNTTGLRGGGLAIYEGTVFLADSVVEENVAVTGGGGIALNYQGRYVNTDNTSVIINNTSASGENDIDDESSVTVMPPPME